MTADDLEHCSTVGAHRAPLQLTALSSYLRDTTLALVEIIDEHVDRNFPGVAPPRILRDLKLKFAQSVAQHCRGDRDSHQGCEDHHKEYRLTKGDFENPKTREDCIDGLTLNDPPALAAVLDVHMD